MSVRAIKKKENQSHRPFKKQQFNQHHISTNRTNLKTRSNSQPDLTGTHKDKTLANCIHSKSESELSLPNKCRVTNQTSANLINAKSETCLKSLSVHKTMEAERLPESEHTPNSSNQFRRMSDRSNVSTSLYTSTSQLQNRGFADTSNIRIPIIGYEVMEERARFTVSWYFKSKCSVTKNFDYRFWNKFALYSESVNLARNIKMFDSFAYAFYFHTIYMTN